MCMQFNIVQCSSVQCSAVKCSAVQCSAVQCRVVQCNIVTFSFTIQIQLVRLHSVSSCSKLTLHCYASSNAISLFCQTFEHPIYINFRIILYISSIWCKKYLMNKKKYSQLISILNYLIYYNQQFCAGWRNMGSCRSTVREEVFPMVSYVDNISMCV